MRASDDEFPLLLGVGLYAADIRGDGNCLFNALSDQLYGHQSEHSSIRVNVIDHMRENAHYYKQFIDVQPGGGTRRNPKRKTTSAYSTPTSFQPPSAADIDRVFEDHLQTMARGGTYGDNMEIVAFSSAFNVNVKIYQRDFAYMVSGGLGHPQNVVHIAYHTWEHYSSIRNIDGPHSGLPDVHDKPLSPDSEARQQQQLANTPYALPWMLAAIHTSLPHLNVDDATIRSALEQCKGKIDDAVSILMEDEAESKSVSSAQDSSGAERDFEPTRRSTKLKLCHATSHRFEDPLLSLSQESGTGTDSDASTDPSSNGGLSNDEATTSRSKSDDIKRVNGMTRPRTILKLRRRGPATDTSVSTTNVAAKRCSGQRISARDRKDIKKQAQKAARKQRQLAATKDSKSQAGSELWDQSMTNTPPIESGLRTLFI